MSASDDPHSAPRSDVTSPRAEKPLRVLAIPAINMSRHTPTVFKTPHLNRLHGRDDERTLLDVCLATTAAPVVRRMAWIPDGQGVHSAYVDGGLWANNPVLAALVEAGDLVGQEPEPARAVHLFVLGNAASPGGENDASAVTRWFEDERGRTEARHIGGGAQLSRLIRMTKKFARSRRSWKSKTTSGICITRLLVDEVGVAHDGLDVALRESWRTLEARLAASTEIVHPVYASRYLSRDADAEIEFFRTKLEWVLGVLAVLDDPECSRARARKAWDEVFDTTFFSGRPDSGGDSGGGPSGKRVPFVVTTSDIARRQQEERFGRG